MYLDVKPATLEYKGVEYQMELGTVERVDLGYEDHGIFGSNLSFAFGSSAQGTGYFSLGNEASTWIKAMLKIFGVSEWSNIKGRKAYVLREEYAGFIKGLVNTDQTEIVIFKELFNGE